MRGAREVRVLRHGEEGHGPPLSALSSAPALANYVVTHASVCRIY